MGPLRAIGLALSALATALASAPSNSLAVDCSKLPENANVVEVSLDGVTRVGSGVVLTNDGYIVTAAHLLFDRLKPPYPLRFYAKPMNGANWLPARLRRIDALLDLALLKLETFPRLKSISAADRTSLAGGSVKEICLSGFGLHKDALGQIIPNPFFSVHAKFLGIELGYILGDQSAEDGYSGGAAFHDGQLLGLIVRRRSPQGTYIIPTSYILDFVAPEGIQLAKSRTFEPGEPVTQLSARVTNNRSWIDANRRDLDLIFRSIEWLISLRKNPQADHEIILTPKRAFPDQILDGVFDGSLTAYFDHPDFLVYLQNNEPISAQVGAVISEGEVAIGNLHNAVALIRGRYLSADLDLAGAPVTRFLIKGFIRYKGGQRGPVYAELKVH